MAHRLRHQLAVRVNHRTFKSLKQEILVDDRDVTPSFVWDKGIGDYRVGVEF